MLVGGPEAWGGAALSDAQLQVCLVSALLFGTIKSYTSGLLDPPFCKYMGQLQDLPLSVHQWLHALLGLGRHHIDRTACTVSCCLPFVLESRAGLHGWPLFEACRNLPVALCPVCTLSMAPHCLRQAA